ncbi:MAG: ribosome biogenesis GTP-binding protein YihA/YsxC [Myxococcota bacterium]|nr:ribosome biogenesis GTP-binding protein YihA/YsxC [Myxococcota bacterium]
MTRADQSSETRVVDAQFVAGAVDATSLPPPTLLEIAFAGRSNVGKSSLLNTMMQRHALARTSRTPGCTRQVNFFEVRCADGLAVRFVDLPGYGWARRSKTERQEWKGMIEGYLRRRTGLKAVVVLVDVRRGIEAEEKQLVDFLQDPRAVSGTPLQIMLVATKIDKVGAAARKLALLDVRRGVSEMEAKVIGFSAVTGDGREELWARIRKAVL